MDNATPSALCTPNLSTRRGDTRRIASYHLLSLRALVEATQYVDALLKNSNSSENFVKLHINQMKPLENTLTLSELLALAAQLTEKK